MKSRLRLPLPTVGLLALSAALVVGCEPDPEPVVTGLTIELGPCLIGEALPGDGGVAVGSTCRSNLGQAVASGTINACLVARGEDGLVRRVPMNWNGQALSQPLGGELGLGPGERFDAALFFLAEADDSGAICAGYAPDAGCGDDARCVLKLHERGATLAADGSTTLDFTDGGGRCVSESGPPFVAEGGTAERCDGMDNDCDRRIDEGFDLDAACTVFGGVHDAVTAPAECRADGVTVCNEAGDGVECGAQAPAIGSERCDEGAGLDDDCDGRIDENLPCFACADDGACAGHPDGEQCVAGRCEICDPFDPAFPGCDPDALCCQSGPEIVCTDGSLDTCTACQNGSCAPTAADGCVGRACACGDGAACSGANPFCVDRACVQCRVALGHQDCGPDELCCAGSCVPTGAGAGQACTDCGTSCDQLSTDRCAERECLCGVELACRAPNPVCDPAAPGNCVECIANAQCVGAAGRPVCDIGRRICVPCLDDSTCVGPRPECVDNACVQCDPADDGAGYRCEEDGDAPICDAGACRACEAHRDCADRPGDLDYCIDGRCRPCDPDGDLGCDDPAAPICDPATQVCRGCDDAGECNENLAPAAAILQCAPDGRCVGCVPDGGATPNLGCDPDGARPVCDDGDEQCRTCATDDECPAQAPFEDGADEALSICHDGRCRMCRPAAEAAPQAGCRPDGSTPICVAGDCAPCASDRQCAAVPGADPVCVDGDCRVCDPADDRGCGDLNFPVCDAETFTCRPCAENAECPAGADGRPGLCVDGVCTGCDPLSNAGCDNTTATPVCADDDGDGLAACRACLGDDECGAVAAAGPDPARGECVEGRCQGCDPVDNAACDVAGPAPFCGRAEAGAFRCRACAADGECAFVAPDTPQCVGGSCRVCDPVGDGAFDDVGCAAPTAVCDPGSFTCRGCVDDGECPEGSLCGSDGVCAGCVPETQRGCDLASDAPVCDADRAVCRACAEDAECAGNPQGELCVEGSCQPCDPDDHRGCGLDALCCGAGVPSCVPTDLDNCAGCGVACGGANACVDRQCACGDGPACSGVAPYCEGDAPDGACVACFTDDDCVVPGYGQCVLGVCTSCDPRLGEGAAGCAPDTGRPYCDPAISACLSCEGDDDRCTEHAGRPECVDDSCYECDPDEPASPTGQVGCDTAGATPYCDPAENACVGCGDEDGRCVDGTRPQCVGDGCFECDPRVLQGYAGCDSTTAAPFCDPETSTCRACTADRECDESPGGGECVGDFCRVCDPTDYAGCGLDTLCCVDDIPGCRATDFAVECEACGVPCDDRISDNCTDRACRCGDQPACEGDFLCVDSVCVECAIDGDCGAGEICVGNACVECDPADDRGCVADSGAPVCGDDFTCRGCGENGECAANPNGTICLGDGTCRVCDPADHDGCGLDSLCCPEAGLPECQPTDPGTQCEACDLACDPLAADTCTDRGCACGDNPVCADGTPFCLAGDCFECRDDGDCGDGTICVGNACVECDPADDRGCVADSDAPVCGDDFACRGCAENGECGANPSGTVCLGDGTCRVCDPADHDGCGLDSLCCPEAGLPECQPTDPAVQCEACDQACDPLAADTCTDRGCACGDGPVCADGTPFCLAGDCFECRDDGDCGDGTICVGNACVECDPADDRGCVADSEAPVCGDDFACRGCGENGECAANGNGTVCLGDGTCRVCDPADHDGCDGDALCCAEGGTPECQPTDPAVQCEACDEACDPATADACTARGCACGAEAACAGDTPFCVESACVECVADGDCGAGTICVGNACVECDPADDRGCDAAGAAPNCQPDATCAACAVDDDCAGNPNGETCLPLAGTCRECNPLGHGGCEANELCCDVDGAPGCVATDPASQCEACGVACDPTTADGCSDRGCACGAADACAGDTPLCFEGDCVACVIDEDCNGNGICVDNACVECDPADDRGCDPASATPLCGGDNTCGACAGESCAGNANGEVCLPSGECRVCDPADHDGCQGDALCCEANGLPACQGTDPAAQCEACGEACDPAVADTCTDRVCGCGGGDACAGDLPFCVDGACVACEGDEDCDPGLACVGNACVECGDNADCEALQPDEPFCSAGTCVECLDGGDCAGIGVCQDGVCLECQNDAQCIGNPDGEVCGASGFCGACNTDDHRGCAANQLCCDANGAPECQVTGSGGTQQCEACGVACSGSNRCTDRACQCGNNPPCDGACFGGICIGG